MSSQCWAVSTVSPQVLHNTVTNHSEMNQTSSLSRQAMHFDLCSRSCRGPGALVGVWRRVMWSRRPGRCGCGGGGWCCCQCSPHPHRGRAVKTQQNVLASSHVKGFYRLLSQSYTWLLNQNRIVCTGFKNCSEAEFKYTSMHTCIPVNGHTAIIIPLTTERAEPVKTHCTLGTIINISDNASFSSFQIKSNVICHTRQINITLQRNAYLQALN